MIFARCTRAREEQADKLFREIIEIADDASGDYVTTSDGKTIVDHDNIQRSRLRVDARQWAAARLAAGRDQYARARAAQGGHHCPRNGGRSVGRVARGHASAAA